MPCFKTGTQKIWYSDDTGFRASGIQLPNVHWNVLILLFIYFIRLTPKFPSCVRTVYRVMCLPAIRFTAGTDSGLLKCLNFVETFSVIWRPCFLRLCLNSEMAEKKKLKKTTPYPSRSRVWITSMTKSSLPKSSFRSTMTCKNLRRSGTQLLVDFCKKVFCN